MGLAIWRLADYVDGAAIDARYYQDGARAMKEAEHLARVYEALNDCPLTRNDVNRYGIVTVWTDQWPDPAIEIRLETAEIEE